MDAFHYQHGELYAEGIPLTEIAEKYQTPCYVYSRATIENNWRAFDSAFGNLAHRICYAVKANSNLAILNLLARLGSGFDIVSIGEMERVLAAGGDPKKIVFSGVGKKPAEILRALELGIFCFNVESGSELERINHLAEATQTTASIALRINPNIDAGTHPYISTGMKENKFGIEIDTALQLCRNLSTKPHLKLIGLACHIGSQLTDLTPFRSAIQHVLDFTRVLEQEGIHLTHLDIGGGLGVRYQSEAPPSTTQYMAMVTEELASCPYEIIIEPGRAICANAGILLTQIEYLKSSPHKNFAIVDAAMNDLIRPALYEAWQDIRPVILNTTAEEKSYDIVGPVCESSDFLGKDRLLALSEGELLAIDSAGAYGFSMSSTYNSRPRIAEVLVDKEHAFLIRKRETLTELFTHESLIP